MTAESKRGPAWRVGTLCSLGLGAALLGAAGAAQTEPADQADPKTITAQLTELRIASGDTDEGHPNERWRLAAMRDYVQGNYRSAAQQFELAAGYADKYSQHRLSLMHWNGEGVPMDRGRAYVWSDLAAERGTPKLVAVREKMWAALSADERHHAIEIGNALFDKYGDARTQMRQIRRMKRFAMLRNGSRAGYKNPYSQVINESHYSVEVMYSAERTDPVTYWRLQNAAIGGGKNVLLEGNVEVGTPQSRPTRSQAEQGAPSAE
ncbi:MAG: hypothetical protein AB7V26_15340 [Lysobacterales bacterium]